VLEVGLGADGKRKQIWRSGFATKRAAQEALLVEQRRRSSGVVITPGWLSVAHYLTERWLPGLVRVRESTHRSYAHHIQRYLVPMLGGRQLADLTTPDVNALTAQLGKGKDRGRFGLAPHRPAGACDSPCRARRRRPLGTGSQQRRSRSAAAAASPSRDEGLGRHPAPHVPRSD